MSLNTAPIRSAYCSIRYGTSLNHSLAHNVFRRYPLSDKILEVDLSQWDGAVPLPHRFYDKHPIESSRISPHFRDYDKGYPPVTALISCICPKEGLVNWQENQIKLLSLPGFKAKNEKRMKTSATLHSLIESCLRDFCVQEKIKSKEQIFEENAKNGELVSDGYLHSILSIFHDLLKEIKAEDRDKICYEQMVYNHRLVYRGRFDAVLPINGQFTLIDWKGCTVGSSKSQEAPDDATLTMENKMQLAAYVGAVNSDPEFAHLPRIKRAAIVKIFESGREAELVQLDEQGIMEAYEQYKGWINAFWWKMANATPMLDRNKREIIDFVT